MKLPNVVSYALKGRDSSYFDFISTFGLNWDCFAADFGLRLGWFLCHVMTYFVALIRTVLVAGFMVLLGVGLGHVSGVVWAKIWCTIATHMSFKTVASGTKLRGFWRNFLSPCTPLSLQL